MFPGPPSQSSSNSIVNKLSNPHSHHTFALPTGTDDDLYVLHAVGEADHTTRTFVTNIESVDHADKPEQDCCVRGQAFGTFYRFQAIPGTNKTKVEVEVHTDPKGWIPNWLTNLIQKKWPRKTLTSLINLRPITLDALS